MLDITYIKENREVLAQVIADKGVCLSLDDLLSVSDTRSGLISRVDALRAERNDVASQIPQASSDERPALIEKGSALKAELSTLEEELAGVEKEYRRLMLLVPNIVHSDTPIGKDDSQNVEVRIEGEKPAFDFEPKDHITLMESLDMVDFERGVKIHGFRGYVLKNAGVMLHKAIMSYALDLMQKHGFTLMYTPSVVREQPMYNTGHFPGSTDEIFQIANTEDEVGGTKESKYLAGTAEVSLVSYYAGEILEKAQLPLKLCAVSPCFRSEVGSYGKDTKGLYRIHEFEKVEQVVLCENDAETSMSLFHEMHGIAEELLQGLGLCYRVLNVCTGDMGAGKYYMQDIESWMPGRGDFGETHSCSNLTDWQARRAQIRYKEEGENRFVHCLNNTVAASPRILIAIVESFQQEDGSILVPEVLRPYMGGMEVISA